MYRRRGATKIVIAGLAAGLALPAIAVVAAVEARAQSRVIEVRPMPQPRNFFEALFPQMIYREPPRYDPRYDPRYRDRRYRDQRFLGRMRNPYYDDAYSDPEPAPKVSAPKYFNYKPDAMVRIDLAALVPARPEPENGTEADPAAFETGAVSGADAAQPRPTALPPVSGEGDAFERVAAHFAGIVVMAEPDIAKALVDHYRKDRRLLWLNDALEPNARARSVLPLFRRAGEYGLDARDYDVDLPLPGATEEAMAYFEVAMTARAVRYAKDAAYGRVNPNGLSGYHDFPRTDDAAAKALAKIAGAGLPTRKLLSMHPDNEAFNALRAELAAEAAQAEDAELIVIPRNILVRPGQSHEEVPNILAAIAKRGSAELKAKAEAALASDAANTTMTPEIVAVVREFQRENNLGVDGVVGPNTISRLTDVDPATKRERVLLAMERLRWLPHDLGNTHVFINQPAFRARFNQDGKARLDMRVVVGKPANQTSFFYDEIETVEFNPYWGVPRSILVNEYLPKLRENPYYLDERGYEVTDVRGRQISSASVDWWSVGDSPPVDVRQRPGPSNALGQLKILFPNKHAIYMHDTPAKNLFERSARAFSHGCVRLQDPKAMAAAVLGKPASYIDEKIAGGHSSEDVAHKIPVYVAYFTAWPTDKGEVEFFADVYGRDARLQEALAKTRSARTASG